jgi:4'-phosphopantetheinyl transferase
MTTLPLAVWCPAAALPAHGTHVWRIDLDTAAPTDDGLLAAHEVARARRIADAARRRHFVALRQAARRILAGYVGAAPEELVLGAGPRGKPHIAWPSTRWVFNQTDSRGMALLTVSDAGPVGIDLEAVRPMARWEPIARRMLSEAACRELAGTPAPARDSLFLAHWTALEARQKATGEGLFGERATEHDWDVRHFAPLPGWIAALALPAGQPVDLSFAHYSGAILAE